MLKNAPETLGAGRSRGAAERAGGLSLQPVVDAVVVPLPVSAGQAHVFGEGAGQEADKADGRIAIRHWIHVDFGGLWVGMFPPYTNSSLIGIIIGRTTIPTKDC